MVFRRDKRSLAISPPNQMSVSVRLAVCLCPPSDFLGCGPEFSTPPDPAFSGFQPLQSPSLQAPNPLGPQPSLRPQPHFRKLLFPRTDRISLMFSRTSSPFGSVAVFLGKYRKKTGASDSQQYPLHYCTHFIFPKCVQQDRGYR